MTSAEIRVALADWYTADEVETWLASPQSLLGGKTAMQLIEAGEGEKVLRLIAQLNDGVYL
jgi:uncharacterized protein (DUF2384 family)